MERARRRQASCKSPKRLIPKVGRGDSLPIFRNVLDDGCNIFYIYKFHYIVNRNRSLRAAWYSGSSCVAGVPEPDNLVVVIGNFLHEHHDPAPQVGIINSRERSDQP